MKRQFLTFIESFNAIDPILVESIKAGFSACFESSFKYNLPLSEATIADLDKYVIDSNFKLIDEGRHRKAFLTPDGKVFKYNAGDDELYNQTEREIDIYYSENKSNVFPQIYAYGDNWVLEEFISTGINSLGIDIYEWNDMRIKISKCDTIDDFKALCDDDYRILKLSRNRRFMKIVNIMFRYGLDLSELHYKNLGTRKNGELVIIDYVEER